MLKVSLGLSLTAAFGMALLAGLYRYGLSLVPELSPPRVSWQLPARVEAALWARFEGGATQNVERMTPLSFVRLRACRVTLGWFRPADGREICLRNHSGVSLASALARQHLRPQSNLGGAARDLGHAATTAWLTRNWSTGEALSALALTASWKQGWIGLEEAAQGLFGERASELSEAQAALLAATLGDAENHSPAADPWCDPPGALEARNRVLVRMARNGALDPATFARSTASPLAVTERGCSP